MVHFIERTIPKIALPYINAKTNADAVGFI
jgi:hypothetical protein